MHGQQSIKFVYIHGVLVRLFHEGLTFDEHILERLRTSVCAVGMNILVYLSFINWCLVSGVRYLNQVSRFKAPYTISCL